MVVLKTIGSGKTLELEMCLAETETRKFEEIWYAKLSLTLRLFCSLSLGCGSWSTSGNGSLVISLTGGLFSFLDSSSLSSSDSP